MSVNKEYDSFSSSSSLSIRYFIDYFISYYLTKPWNAINSPVQESFENFKNLKFYPFESKSVLLDDLNNPDKNFHNNIQAVDTQYFLPSELLPLPEKLHINSENLSMIHLNIRSAKTNYEKPKDFFSQTISFFKALCLTETWFDDRNSKIHFTNCHNTQLFINRGVLLVKKVGEVA